MNLNRILAGRIWLDRGITSEDFWLSEPFSRPQAFLDLMMLANDQPRTVRVRDLDVPVKRGQLARSQVTLAQRWQWSVEKVKTFLSDYQDARKLSYQTSKITTIITILDYPSAPVLAEFDAPETASEPGTETASEPGTETAQKGERGKGKGEKGKEEVPPPPGTIPSDGEVKQFCESFLDLSRGITGIPEVWWTGWLSNQLKRQKFPADWQRALKLDFTSDFQNRHPKALANCFAQDGSEKKNGGPNLKGRTAAQARFEIQREIEALEENRHALYQTNIEPDEADERRLAELRTELKKIAANDSERVDRRAA